MGNRKHPVTRTSPDTATVVTLGTCGNLSQPKKFLTKHNTFLTSRSVLVRKHPMRWKMFRGTKVPAAKRKKRT